MTMEGLIPVKSANVSARMSGGTEMRMAAVAPGVGYYYGDILANSAGLLLADGIGPMIIGNIQSEDIHFLTASGQYYSTIHSSGGMTINANEASTAGLDVNTYSTTPSTYGFTLDLMHVTSGVSDTGFHRAVSSVSGVTARELQYNPRKGSGETNG